jgi:hypothetical protein
MKFKGQPGLFVKICNKYIQRATMKKGLYFDDKGEYETENPILIKALSQHFEIVEEIKEEKPKMKCKHCEFETDNKGLLMAHYREHKKE